MNITHEITPVRQYPFIAGFWLIAALPICAVIVLPLNEILDFKDLYGAPTLIIMFTVHFATGYMWAYSLGHRAGLPYNKLMNISGGIGFALGVVGLLGGLSEFAPILIDPWLGKFKGVGNLEFGALFAPVIGIVAGLAGLGLGLGLRDIKVALKFLALGFITGLGLYLAIMFTMQLLGFKVGSGRPVMLPTTFLSMWVTALVGSALFGKMLKRSKPNLE